MCVHGGMMPSIEKQLANQRTAGLTIDRCCVAPGMSSTGSDSTNAVDVIVIGLGPAGEVVGGNLAETGQVLSRFRRRDDRDRGV
jgi:hypothetical protein